jgi:hypothetical protein
MQLHWRLGDPGGLWRIIDTGLLSTCIHEDVMLDWDICLKLACPCGLLCS